MNFGGSSRSDSDSSSSSSSRTFLFLHQNKNTSTAASLSSCRGLHSEVRNDIGSFNKRSTNEHRRCSKRKRKRTPTTTPGPLSNTLLLSSPLPEDIVAASSQRRRRRRHQRRPLATVADSTAGTTNPSLGFHYYFLLAAATAAAILMRIPCGQAYVSTTTTASSRRSSGRHWRSLFLQPQKERLIQQQPCQRIPFSSLAAAASSAAAATPPPAAPPVGEGATQKCYSHNFRRKIRAPPLHGQRLLPLSMAIESRVLRQTEGAASIFYKPPLDLMFPAVFFPLYQKTASVSTTTGTTASATLESPPSPLSPSPSLLLESSIFRSSSSSSSHSANKNDKAQTQTTLSATSSSSSSSSSQQQEFSYSKKQPQKMPPRQGYGPSIHLTADEKQLFELLKHVHEETGLQTVLRVAGGWVRDKLLATPGFHNPAIYHNYNTNSNNDQQQETKPRRLTEKFRKPAGAASMGRLGTKVLVNNKHDDAPVDIDIALDDMLGREFADHLNAYLSGHGQNKVPVGVVLKNPEKSKHLETATMKVGAFWVDFVNLRAEEYTQDSRIPDLMRIGTAEEDSFRRDLTINTLFYNINTGQVEDWTGRGFDDLRRGVVATPMAPLTTLLDDPLRVLRSVRFAARLRFNMDAELIQAAKDDRVKLALAQKVSSERVGGEIDLMLRSPDPVGAMRLLVNLQLADTVFPLKKFLSPNSSSKDQTIQESVTTRNANFCFSKTRRLFDRGHELLSTCHDHLADCRLSPPLWCSSSNTYPQAAFGAVHQNLVDDEEAQRLLWFAAFLKPFRDECEREKAMAPGGDVKTSRRKSTRKANRSSLSKLLVDELKRPTRDADAVEVIMKTADDFQSLLDAGCDVSATVILLNDISITYDTVGGKGNGGDAWGVLRCQMGGRPVDPAAREQDPVWEHAMQFRLLCSKVIRRAGPLWRAALFLAIAEQLGALDDLTAIEGDVVDESQEERRQGVIERFDAFASALQHMSLIGIWNQAPLLRGEQIQTLLPGLPKGPAFRDVMEEQQNWMITHPGADASALQEHLQTRFAGFVTEPTAEDAAANAARVAEGAAESQTTTVRS